MRMQTKRQDLKVGDLCKYVYGRGRLVVCFIITSIKCGHGRSRAYSVFVCNPSQIPYLPFGCDIRAGDMLFYNNTFLYHNLEIL